jgi:hypothetical protein
MMTQSRRMEGPSVPEDRGIKGSQLVLRASAVLTESKAMQRGGFVIHLS